MMKKMKTQINLNTRPIKVAGGDEVVLVKKGGRDIQNK